MPADPTTSVPPSQHLSTDPSMIGHVAPDFDNRKLFNTLVIRPEYRIALRLGVIDELCPQPPSTSAGRQMRLQLLGYFHEPLNSANVTAAFNTVWQWFTTDLAKAQDDLVNELTSGIVENGTLPQPGQTGRILLPGSFCINASNIDEALGTPTDATAAQKHVKFRAEDSVWDNNPVLGCIPVIATVERRSQDDLQWRPVPNAWVYLQLIRPDDLSDADKPLAVRTTALTPSPPTPASNPDTYISTRIANPPGVTARANDPQVDNCHSKFGGKRGLGTEGDGSDVGGNGRERLFNVQSQAGFNTAQTGRTMSHQPYNVPQKVSPSGTQHTHAVKAQTNADGEAGFIFTPSRTGGDRYKLRAYIGPDTLPSDGTGIMAVSVDTGTLVIWRRIRIARYLVWDYPSGYTQPTSPPPPTDMSTWTRRQQLDFRVRSMGNISLNNVCDEFSKAYLFVNPETSASRTLITTTEWQNARNHAVANFATVATDIPSIANFPAAVDLNALFPSTPFTDNPCIFRVADRATYNSTRGSTFGALSASTYNNIIARAIRAYLNSFLHYFSRNALPFTVIQAPFGDSITFSGVDPTGGGAAVTNYFTTSGEATCARGCHLWWGQLFYNVFSYPLGIDHNTVHETGHCHFGPHQFTSRDTSGTPTGVTSMLRDHDQHDFCVMGYLGCAGDFCGRCVLKLRGWDVLQLPAN